MISRRAAIASGERLPAWRSSARGCMACEGAATLVSGCTRNTITRMAAAASATTPATIGWIAPLNDLLILVAPRSPGTTQSEQCGKMTYCVRALLTRQHEIPLISGNAFDSVDDEGRRVGVPQRCVVTRTLSSRRGAAGGGLLLRNRHLVHLHRQCDRGVVAEQDEHFRDALAAERLFDLREFGVRQLRPAHQRRGKPMDGTFMCIGELRILAGEDRVDGLLREAGGLALADMRLPDVVALTVLRDHQNADLHLALRQRRELVEEGADPLHAAGDGRTVDPDLVRPEDAPAPGGELIEDLALLG